MSTGARTLLHGFGRAVRSGASVVTVTDPAAVTRTSAEPPGRGLLARGLGRSYGDAAQNAGGVVLDMTALPNIHSFDHATGVIDADAGLSLDALMRHVVPHGWFPHVTPGTRHVTLGGALAADVHGKNHHVDGSWAAGVQSFVLVTPPADGGEPTPVTITPESDAAAFWATVGGLGLTGIVTRTTLQLVRIPSAFLAVDTERTADIDDTLGRMEEGDRYHQFSVAWLDCLARGRKLGRAVLTQADWVQPTELPSRHRAEPHVFDPAVVASVPDITLPRMLTKPAVRCLNSAWYVRAPRRRRTEIQTIASYFHPLDAVEGWNRLYGRRGFLQYQFVVPHGAEDTVRIVVETASRMRVGPFLAVLKRMGPANPGPLSFPQPGWTLAMDFAVGSEELPATLSWFDALVAAAGGRVYLAKDATLRPELLATMYPRLPEWRSTRDRLDPGRHMTSDLDRRLGLSSARIGRRITAPSGAR